MRHLVQVRFYMGFFGWSEFLYLTVMFISITEMQYRLWRSFDIRYIIMDGDHIFIF